MAIIRWEPFRPEDFSGIKIPKLATGLLADMYDSGDSIVAEISIPGIDPKDVSIEIDDDYLMVSGQRAVETEEEGKDFYYKEIQRGSFNRSFKLPVFVDSKKASAEFSDGILTITMPKSKKTRSTKIKVEEKKKNK